MKKLLILMVAVMLVTVVNAQNNKRTSAFNYFKNGKLDKAKEYIDPTIEHPTTMNVAKTWYYRGNIYLQIALTDNAEYRALEPNALEVAYQSYKKVLELDERGEYTQDVMHNFKVIASNFFNGGVAKYNEGKYMEAASDFQHCFDVSQNVNVVDTTALSNVALSYEIAGQTDLALAKYMELEKLGYNNPMVYNSLSTIYLSKKDTTQAEAYIMKGREKFPEDYQLLIAETNLFLARGQNEKAIANLTKALEKDASNKTIWFALGTNYENVGNKEGAAEAYQKAIDIDPDYADAYYNMGAMYNNQAAEIIEKANELPLNAVKEYNEEKAKADALLEKALPYLEKSDELNPDNLATLQTLKQIYTILKNMEKLQAVNERIKNVTQ